MVVSQKYCVGFTELINVFTLIKRFTTNALEKLYTLYSLLYFSENVTLHNLVVKNSPPNTVSDQI